MTKDEALRMAIEIMERLHQPNGNSVQLAIQACKEALAETQEPKPPTILARLPNGATVSNVYEAYETGLKEGKAETQEAVAYIMKNDVGRKITITKDELDNLTTGWTYIRDVWKNATPLYTTPPSREWVGLSDEEISDVYCNTPAQPISNGDVELMFDFAKAIEAKLKEKNV